MFYLGWNGLIWLKAICSFQQETVYWLAITIFSYAYILGRLVKPLSWLSIVGSIWFGYIQYGLLLFPVANLVVWVLDLTGVPGQTSIVMVGTVTAIMIAFILIFGLYNAYSPVIRKYEVTIPKKTEMKKIHLAVASDMHFGKLSGVAHAKRLVKMIDRIKPDIILLPGDIIDDEPEHFQKKNMGAIMKQLDAPLGIYGVLGNHEYYGREIPQFLKEMEKVDIRILMDEVILVGDSFYLLGRKDKTDLRRKSFQQLVNDKDIDVSLPLIAMDHQPAELKEAQESGVDLIVSGHTHRGQMTPNHLITKRLFELDWGYLNKDQLHAFVSSGFGFWGPPFRIGSRSEVLEIVVKFEDREGY
ncbi:metallophosphoesterase [Bacillus sp. RO2]|jgi:predicted MPP superfamily phosphohydrolase|uniref:metallophosphoesterase n=1 Tax=Bacillus sp. RO2 TaxID=2723913 RepID=UPI00145CFDA9|nr:metallophosphoesterase [Bacillus sp. RO2]NMH71799.1 metallophosphoesterase [Bacillus sp. RO2]